MTEKRVTFLYDTYEDAARTVRELEEAHVPSEDISVVASNADNWHRPGGMVLEDNPATGAGTGATIGAVLGGGAGLLAGLGMLAIPGVGPVVAAGWLISTLAGAAAGAGVGAASGGIVDGLTSAGVTAEHANVYAEGVRRGGTLVTVRVDEAKGPAVEAIMRANNFVDPERRGSDYRRAGWQQFDPAATNLTPEDLKVERARRRLAELSLRH